MSPSTQRIPVQEVEDSPHPGVPRRPGVFSRAFFAGIAVLALVSAYFTFSPSQLNMYTYNLCLLAVLGALALNLLMGTVGQASLGNAAFIAVGGFSTAFLDQHGVGAPADVLLSAAAAAVLGIVVGFPALRIRGLYLVLATLAAYYIVIYFANAYTSDTVGGSGFQIAIFFQNASLIDIQRLWIWLLTAVVVAVLVILRSIDRNRVGRAWRLIRDHEVAAPAVGITVARYKLGAFALSSALLGLEGSLLAHFTGSVTVDAYPLALSIAYVAMVLLGGLDSMLGAVIGAGLVTAIPIVVPEWISHFQANGSSTELGANIATVIYGLLIIFFITRSQRGIGDWLNALGRRVWGWWRRRSAPAGEEHAAEA
jgi:branched-chain amino acid transport system permease protein